MSTLGWYQLITLVGLFISIYSGKVLGKSLVFRQPLRAWASSVKYEKMFEKTYGLSGQL